MKQEHGGDWAGYREQYGTMPLDFSANISPLGLPRSARDAAIRALENAARYPDPECRLLRQSLSVHHGVPAENIVCGNGAADLIWRICRVLRPSRALVPAPTFGEYEKALRSVGCAAERFYLAEEQDFSLDAESFARSVRDHTDLVFLCNPNNPTGRLSSREELRIILDACRAAGAVLVLDECFLDFTAEPEKAAMTGELAERPELVVLKAFTKTYAMAGLRLGYALCGDAAFAERLRQADQPWPVSQVAQEAGIAALQETDYVTELRALIAGERRRMQKVLRDMGLRVIPGEANYLLFYCSDEALCGKLCARGILLRGCGEFPGLGPGWYRTAVRTEKENTILLTALEEVLTHG